MWLLLNLEHSRIQTCVQDLKASACCRAQLPFGIYLLICFVLAKIIPLKPSQQPPSMIEVACHNLFGEQSTRKLIFRENSAQTAEIRDCNFSILLTSHEEIPRLRAITTTYRRHTRFEN
jgi:hypothetical protein